MGELSLTGSVRPVAGAEQRLSAAAAAGLQAVVVPAAEAPGERRVRGLELIPVRHLRDALHWMAHA